MKKFKIMVCLLNKAPEVLEVESPWKYTKKLLDGAMIEIVYLDDGVQAFIDEEGRFKELPLNRLIPAKGREVPTDIGFVIKTDPNLCDPGEDGVWDLHGDFILTRHDMAKDEPLSLTDEDIKKYTELFKEITS
jgi:hypothetical protein